MAHDLLPDMELGRPSHSAGYQGTSGRSVIDALPLAHCSLRSRTKIASTGFRKGFLGSSAEPKQQGGACDPKSHGLTAIKPSKKIQQGPSIPDFLRVPSTEAEQKGLLYRDMLQEVMQPDEATLSRIMEDSTVMEAFYDPAVMSAVAEIAHNPEAYSKHAAKIGSAGFCRISITQPQHDESSAIMASCTGCLWSAMLTQVSGFYKGMEAILAPKLQRSALKVTTKA